MSLMDAFCEPPRRRLRPTALPEALKPPFLSDRDALVLCPPAPMSSMDVFDRDRTPLLSHMNAWVRPAKALHVAHEHGVAQLTEGDDAEAGKSFSSCAEQYGRRSERGRIFRAYRELARRISDHDLEREAAAGMGCQALPYREP